MTKPPVIKPRHYDLPEGFVEGWDELADDDELKPRAFVVGERSAPTPLQTYHVLLREAFSASEEVDMYDVRSEIPASKAEWDRLCAESDAAQARLVEHVGKHLFALAAEFGAQVE